MNNTLPRRDTVKVGLNPIVTRKHIHYTFEYGEPTHERTHRMTTGTFLLILLVFILIGSLPTWSHSRNWGYYPSSGLGLVILVLLILILLGRI